LEAIAGNIVVVVVVDIVVLDLLPATWLPPSSKVRIVEPFENPKFCVQRATHATVNPNRAMAIVEVKSLLVFAVCTAVGDAGFELSSCYSVSWYVTSGLTIALNGIATMHLMLLAYR
jgi:hypothetical protein